MTAGLSAARNTDEPNGASCFRSQRASVRERPSSTRSTVGDGSGSWWVSGVDRTFRASRSAANIGNTPENP